MVLPLLSLFLRGVPHACLGFLYTSRRHSRNVHFVSVSVLVDNFFFFLPLSLFGYKTKKKKKKSIQKIYNTGSQPSKTCSLFWSIFFSFVGISSTVLVFFPPKREYKRTKETVYIMPVTQIWGDNILFVWLAYVFNFTFASWFCLGVFLMVKCWFGINPWTVLLNLVQIRKSVLTVIWLSQTLSYLFIL